MQGNGKYHQRRLLPRRFYAFHFFKVNMEVWQHFIYTEQKDYSHQKAYNSRPYLHETFTVAHFNGRDQQAPYARRDHDTPSKPQHPIHKMLVHAPEKENKRRPQRGDGPSK